MSTYAYLAAARDLISSPARWRAWVLAADEGGQPVSPLGDAAGYCLAGALQHATGRVDWQNADGLLGRGQRGLAWLVISAARDLYPELAGQMDVPGAVNNRLGHDAVLRVLDTALERAALDEELAAVLA